MHSLPIPFKRNTILINRGRSIIALHYHNIYFFRPLFASSNMTTRFRCWARNTCRDSLDLHIKFQPLGWYFDYIYFLAFFTHLKDIGPSLGRLPSKAKDLHLAMRHSYPPSINLVFQYHRFIIIIIIFELTHSKTILEITDEIEPQPAVLDFKNLSQYSSCST